MIFYKDGHLSIRTMEENDVNKIFNHFHEQGCPKSKAILEKYWIGQNQKELSVFVAEYEGDTAGYAVLYPFAKTGPFADKSIPEISDFNVFSKYQKKGIGNKILDEAEKKAAEWSSQVSLGVGLHSGYGSAQRIYAKRGYLPDGSGAWYHNKQLEQYADCKNDDDLILFLYKDI